MLHLSNVFRREVDTAFDINIFDIDDLGIPLFDERRG